MATPDFPDFRPTHVVPQAGMPAWESPDVSRPTEPLDPLLPVQLIGRRGDWGEILCANGWSAWVDARLLVSVPQGPPGAHQPLARTADPRPLLARVEESLSQYRRAAEDLASGRTDGESFHRRTLGLRVGVVVDGESVWLYEAEHERWVYCDGTRLSTYAASSGPGEDTPPPNGGPPAPDRARSVPPEPTQVVAEEPARTTGSPEPPRMAAAPEPTQVVAAEQPEADTPQPAQTAPPEPTQVVAAEPPGTESAEPDRAAGQEPTPPVAAPAPATAAPEPAHAPDPEPTQVGADTYTPRPDSPESAHAAEPQPTQIVATDADGTNEPGPGHPPAPDPEAVAAEPAEDDVTAAEPTQVVDPARLAGRRPGDGEATQVVRPGDGIRAPGPRPRTRPGDG
ncbi:hypothetical protein [Streptomyces sp. ISL-98]|uniref:hypothetical protein n=1 Tax=Streptomyces sp. ISL-98 TaxID=2819192 RepID=UPI0035B340A1